MNPVVVVHFVAGCLVVGTSFPFILGKVKMNEVSGVKIAAAFSSDSNWYQINRYGGRMLLRYGLALVLTALAGLFFKKPTWVAYNYGSLVVVAGGLVCAVAATTIYANRLTASGRRKKIPAHSIRFWASLGITIILIIALGFWNGRPAQLTSVRLVRTGCLGICPSYEVTVFSDGRVVFLGRGYVEYAGSHERTISREKFTELEKKVQTVRFTQMKDKYTADITDLPHAITTVTSPNDSKTVDDYIGGPRGLAELDAVIDEVAGTAEWIGTRSSNPARH